MKFKTFIALTVVALFFVACGDKKDSPKAIDPAFTNYISAFTGGVISNQASIKVQLTESIKTAVANEELKLDVFDFSPNLEGKAIWIDDRTIQFQPSELIPSGKIFDIEFELGKLLGVPSKLETFEFRVQTINQGIFVVFDGIEAYNNNSLEWQQLKGSYQLNDFAEPESIRKSLKAIQAGKELKVNWEFNSNSLTHIFEVDSVARGENESKVLLLWDGESIGAEIKGEEEITIPSLSDFKVMSVSLEQLEQQTITINFSDPLDIRQNLNGLIFSDKGDDFRIRKDRNTVYLYPSKDISGTRKLTITKAIKNASNYPLTEEYSRSIAFNNTKPEVAFLGKGNIVPSKDGFKIPIKAVNLNAVNVKVVKIFENNVQQFFQLNQLNGSREMKRVGRVIAKQSIPLLSDKSINYSTWNTFHLDLTKLVQAEPGAIYRVMLSFDQSQSLYSCEEKFEPVKPYVISEKELDFYDKPSSYYYDYYDDYYYDGYYNDTDNPCKPAYYGENNHAVSRNVLTSDIGVIAKSGDENSFIVAVTDLKTTNPISGATIELMNYQNQIVGSATTGADGFASINLKRKPYLLIVKNGSQRAYLRVDDGSSLSLSMFNVSGARNEKGVKGLIYGERGVWRPGDSLFLNFILEDKNEVLPESFPVIFELYTPDNQLFKREVKNRGLNGFYDLRTKTSATSPTGNWQAKVKVGSSTFYKRIKVEAIKPNRLKIKVDFENKILTKGNTNGIISAKWLHGADANSLRATIEMNLSGGNTNFKGYDGFVFDDPSKRFSTGEEMIFDGKLDETGNSTISPKINIGKGAPGMLNASLKTRVFENGGDFSVDRFKVKYSPYQSYVGVKLPKGNGWNDALYSDEANLIAIATLDENGNTVDRKDMKIEVFDIRWRWWWERGNGDELARYVNNRSTNLIKSATVSTKNGKGLFELKFKEQKWGRKLIRITDPVSGHSTGVIFYMTYKGWWNNGGNNPGGAEMLNFEPEKKKYQVGEQAKLNLPYFKEGRVLVSIESGSRVLSTFWKDATDVKEGISFEVTEEMAPNVYAHLILIQPHATTANDLPIRMYGVQNIEVESEKTHLNPQLNMPSELKPEQEVSLSVSEKDGKAMTYTVAMVDEGLLDLTRFVTPNPWPEFYKNEALGVKTWDMYQFVMGAFSGEISGLLALGGDGNLKAGEGNKANRFEPVVRFLGPFYLEDGETNEHSFTMPNYVGSVRTMVIAGDNGAYGATDKTTPVKKPLMVLATLPRVISPSEKLKLPISVFAMDAKIKNVRISLESNEFIQVNQKTQQLKFSKVGDKMAYFDIEVARKIGVGKLKVTVEGHGEKATQEIEIDVRLPNPEIDETFNDVVELNEIWTKEYSPIGIEGTNSGAIEISTIPPLNLEKRIRYLIQYPHGCVEQTTSAVFPQLFLSDLIELDTDRKNEIQRNVTEGLNKLRDFQLNSGAFAYWQGYADPNIWGTNYAGHFMLEAKNKGYAMPSGMVEDWVKFQTKAANSWQRTNANYESRGYIRAREFEQAYRLYTLALAGKPALGAMNRLREQQTMAESTKWRLAAAYALTNKIDVAKQLVNSLSISAENSDYYYTYGSRTRDQAMILETLELLGDKIQGKRVLDDLAKALSDQKWMSTQTTAYSLLAVAKFVKAKDGNTKLKYDLIVNGKKTSVDSDKSIQLTELPMKTGKLQVKNKSGRTLFVNLSLSGVPIESDQLDKSSRLSMQVSYLKLDGTPIDISKLNQGVDFMAEVRIAHPGGVERNYEDLALTQMFPSGWEIRNLRMDETTSKLMRDIPQYQDVRDDRVFTYFDLTKSKVKKFRVLLNAAYLGKFYLPAVECSAMYDNDIQAIKSGRWIEVVQAGK